MHACLTDYGDNIVNMDVDESVAEGVNAGESPIGEPGVAFWQNMQVNDCERRPATVVSRKPT